jgi:hypothetical protein
MKNIVFILILAVTNPVIGQRHFVGMQSGVNLSSVDQRSFSDRRTAFSGGLTYDYKLTSELALSSGFHFNPRGLIVEQTEYDSFIGRMIRWKTINRYNYLSIPLMVTYSGTTRVYPFVSVGAVPSILLKANSTIQMLDFQDASVSFDRTKVVSRVDLAGVLAAGGGLRVAQRWAVLVTASYQKSLTSTTETYTIEPDVVEKFHMKHKAVTFSVGLQLAMLKRSVETSAD